MRKPYPSLTAAALTLLMLPTNAPAQQEEVSAAALHQVGA